MHLSQNHFLSISAALAGAAVARPATVLEQIQDLHARANPCEPGGTPILYKDYGPGSCPPKYPLVNNGTCDQEKPEKQKGFFKGAPSCTFYCELQQNFFYAQEKPLDQPTCHGPLTCTVGENKAEAYAWNGGAKLDWKINEALTIGVTGGYTQTETTTTITTKSIKLDQNQCGYFTFLPIVHKSCGDLAEGTMKDVPVDHCINFKDTKNYCTTQPYRSQDDKFVLGDTVFVYTDCSNRERLPMDKQDPAYRHDGVALPQSAFITFMNHHNATGGGGGGGSSGCKLTPECQDPFGAAVNPACLCHCDGTQTNLEDPRCKGFKGTLPDPPSPCSAGGCNGAPIPDLPKPSTTGSAIQGVAQALGKDTQAAQNGKNQKDGKQKKGPPKSKGSKQNKNAAKS